jgi:hypothetical protein
VARANVLAVEGEPTPGAYNVGTGIETSVNELYELARDISGRDLPASHGPAKPGEQLRSSIDPARAQAASWAGALRYHSPRGSKRRFGPSVRCEAEREGRACRGVRVPNALPARGPLFRVRVGRSLSK